MIVVKNVYCPYLPKASEERERERSFKVILAGIQYSASIQERDTKLCFLLNLEIRESPRKKQNPVVEWRSIGSHIQSASE
jgi:hypothetical protein